MIPSLLDYILIKNKIPVDILQECMECVESADYNRYLKPDTAERVPHTSVQHALLPKELNDKINKLVNPFLNSYKLTRNIEPLTKLDFWTINKYDVNCSMNIHTDNYKLVDNIPKTVVLNLIILLNDNYTGGELYFFKDHKLDINPGDVIIYPGNFLFPHEVKKVLSGSRYTLVTSLY